MYEIAPDRPDIEEYEAEKERARVQRRRKKIAAVYEREEINAEEKEIEKYEFIPD